MRRRTMGNEYMAKRLVAFFLISLFITIFSPGSVFGAKPGKNAPKSALSAKKKTEEAEISSFFRGVKKEVLPNGLTIITLQRDYLPLVSINIFVNTGSINEDEKTTGITHFCEHLFYRGTEKRTGVGMKRDIENLGGHFNAETSKDYTRYYVNVPSEYGLKALEIYCDAVKNAAYPEETIEKERKVILEEFNLTRQNPGILLSEKIYSMAFSQHPYGREVIGTKERISNFTRQDFLDYKHKYYTPDNMVIVIVGDLDRDKYLRFIRSFFADMPGGAPNRQNNYSSVPLDGHKEVIDEKPIMSPKAYFVMAYRSPGMQDTQDVLAMDMLVFMLGQGENSILNRELHKKRKLVDDMGADFLTMKDPGLVMFSTQIEPSHIERLKEAVLTVLWEMKKGKFTEEEMVKARNLLLKSYTYGNETNEGKADALGFYELLKNVDFALNYESSIKKITREDIIRAANKYFDDNYILYVLKPAPRRMEEE